LSSDYFTVTPQVLEAIGGKVPATISGRFPEKYFNKKAIVEVTPVLRWQGGEAKSQTYTFQGEKVKGNNPTIQYKAGGNYTMRANFDYVPEMAKSELYLDFVATIGSKVVTIPSVKIADGVISTSEMVNQTVESANASLGQDAFQRIIPVERRAVIALPAVHQRGIQPVRRLDFVRAGWIPLRFVLRQQLRVLLFRPQARFQPRADLVLVAHFLPRRCLCRRDKQRQAQSSRQKPRDSTETPIFSFTHENILPFANVEYRGFRYYTISK